jgi:hypothetical protein
LLPATNKIRAKPPYRRWVGEANNEKYMFHTIKFYDIQPTSAFIRPEEFQNTLRDYTRIVENRTTVTIAGTPTDGPVTKPLQKYLDEIAYPLNPGTRLAFDKDILTNPHLQYLAHINSGNFYPLYTIAWVLEYSNPHFWTKLLQEVKQPGGVMRTARRLGNNIYLLTPPPLLEGGSNASMVYRVEKCIAKLVKAHKNYQQDVTAQKHVNFAFKEVGWLATNVESLKYTSYLEEDVIFKQKVLEIFYQLEAMWEARQNTLADFDLGPVAQDYLEKHNWSGTHVRNRYKTNLLVNRADPKLNSDRFPWRMYLRLYTEKYTLEERIMCFGKKPTQVPDDTRRFIADWTAENYKGVETLETLRKSQPDRIFSNNPDKPNR